MQIVVTCDSYEELIAVAKQILRDHADEPVPKPAKPAVKEKPAPKKAEPAPEPDPELPFKEEEKEGEAKDGTDIDETAVKVLLAGKIKSGKKAEMRALFESYGVSKISELIEKSPDKLNEFYHKAEAL